MFTTHSSTRGFSQGRGAVGQPWPGDVSHPTAAGYGEAMNLGPTELIIILVIVLVIFGGAKLPKLARSLGEAQKEFKKGSDDAEHGTSESSDGGSAGPIS